MKSPLKNLHFWLASIFGIVCAIAGVLMALALGRSVDAAISRDINELFIAAGITLASVIGSYVTDIYYHVFTFKYARSSMEKAKNKLFSNMLKNTETDVDENIAMYTTNTDVVYEGYFMAHPLLVYFTAQFLLSVAGVIYLDWRLFIVTLSVSFLPMLAPIFFQKRLANQMQDYSDKSKEYINNVTDSTNGIYEIKSFYAQKFFEKRHSLFNKDTEKSRASYYFISSLLGITSGAFGGLTFVIIVLAGGYLVIQDYITAGAMLAAVQLLAGIVAPVGYISATMGEMAAAKKIAKQYYIESDEPTGVDVSKFNKLLKMEKITFTYPNTENPIIKDYNISLIKGYNYAITGESGCGKTTLAKIIAGVLPYDSGSLKFDNIEVKDTNLNLYGMKVRYINQDAYLFNLSIKDNTELGCNTGNYLDVLNNLGLFDITSRTDTEFIENIEHLSAGQKQRIILGRALNRLPDILILDEPTANLDIETAINVVEYLMTFDELTLIVITHSDNKNLLDLFDEVIKM
jgi:ABC-type bacteriocin/lantibiotic exporter with double-glycine peptidase domain